jgi:hypothetical protein
VLSNICIDESMPPAMKIEYDIVNPVNAFLNDYRMVMLLY